jgi:hypothetical protein
MPTADDVKKTSPVPNSEPAKGGTEPASRTPRPSGDSSKPHGDPLQRVVEKKTND